MSGNSLHRPGCAALGPGGRDCDMGCANLKSNHGSERRHVSLHTPECVSNPGPKCICQKHPFESAAPGVKLDEGKPKLWRGVIDYFPHALISVAEVSEKGATAPGHVWGGWMSVPEGFERYTEAMVRHLLEETQIAQDGIALGTGHPRPDLELREKRIFAVATVAWNALARLEHLILDMRE